MAQGIAWGSVACGSGPPAPQPSVVAEPEVSERTALAPPWRVLIHNDDVTPMDFVVHILVGIFALDSKRAARVMLEAHTKGIAHVVTLSLEEAEARVEKAHSLARTAKYPLTFTYEPE